ncbi:unnamed protein product [Wuchereria bancrofti]|uniref:Uncharacterized protein n=1 Tax=Wuchereria bancrofti TaxID=6293 RepID=A0A3P7GGZ7_WUCBA|nr:unnamed protein product [Wuchereria bancrofti]
MHSIWSTTITVFFLCATVERSNAALKNQTGEGRYYWGQPYGLPQWQTQQGWAPQQNWMQPQGGISSQGWALSPPGGIPMTGWVPSSMQQTPSPFLWTLFDDRNVCTLDASILVVLENDGSTAPGAMDVNAQLLSAYYGGDLSSNAVRMPCSSIATTSAQACTACCKMACKHYTISVASFYAFFNTVGIKRQGSIPPQTLPPLPPVSCVCCGPRRFFTNWSPSAPNSPPQPM